MPIAVMKRSNHTSNLVLIYHSLLRSEYGNSSGMLLMLAGLFRHPKRESRLHADKFPTNFNYAVFSLVLLPYVIAYITVSKNFL